MPSSSLSAEPVVSPLEKISAPTEQGVALVSPAASPAASMPTPLLRGLTHAPQRLVDENLKVASSQTWPGQTSGLNEGRPMVNGLSRN
jgi:hypothetical protein